MQHFSDYIKYLSIPYVENGRDFNGADCYGLVLLFLENKFGLNIDESISYSSINQLDEIHNQVESIPNEVLRISNKHNLEFGDVVVFKVHGKFDSHAGIYLGNDFIHTQKRRGASIDNLFSHYWASRFSFGLRVVK